MQGPIGWNAVVGWAGMAIGAGYLSVSSLRRWQTNPTALTVLGGVMGLLCLSAIIHVGNHMGWWSLIYRP